MANYLEHLLINKTFLKQHYILKNKSFFITHMHFFLYFTYKLDITLKDNFL